MKFAVYTPAYAPYPAVLVPEFLQPSARIEKLFDSLTRRGVMSLDINYVRSLSNPAHDDEQLNEYAITAPKHAYELGLRLNAVEAQAQH